MFMPTIIGQLEAENRLSVTRLRGQDFPEQGYVVGWEQIPPQVPYPEPKIGVEHVMYWHPQEPNSPVWFEEEKRDLTPDEITMLAHAIRIETDKSEIVANGEDYATITMHVPDYLDVDTVYFIVNGEPQVEESPIVDGKAECEVAVEDEGLYLIEALVGGESRKLVLKGVSA